MSKIYVRTNANNAEKTIRRAIESVLNQTYCNLIYYINDNGSTDGTRKIIEEYAEKDSRIVPFYNKKNRVYEDEYIRKNFCELTENIEEDDFLCYLDADDEYYPKFLEEMLDFMEKNHLDIGCCGSDMLSDKLGNAVIAARKVNEDLFIQDNGFERFFPYYHQFARVVWGKLYKGFTLKGHVCYDPGDNSYPSYGSDTIETLRAFSNAERVGISTKILHKYYIYEKSDSYRFDSRRVVSDQLQHNMTVDYLLKYGPVSQVNRDFLYSVYANAVKDSMEVVLGSQESDTKKLQEILKILSCSITRNMLRCENVGDEIKRYLLKFISKWAINYKEETQDKISAMAYLLSYAVEGFDPMLGREFYSALMLKTPKLIKPMMAGNFALVSEIINKTYRDLRNSVQELGFLEVILSAKQNKAAEVFENCRRFIKQFPESIYKSEVEHIVEQTIHGKAVLKDISLDFAIQFSPIISLIIQGKELQAFEKIVEIFEERGIPDDNEGQFCYLGQNLACRINDQAGFIFLKKLTILYLIEKNLIKEAEKELSDFDILLPDDEDFKGFRNYIDKIK